VYDEATKQASSSGGLDLGNHVSKVLENIKKDPELQAQVAQAAKENGIDPMLLKAAMPGMDVPDGAQEGNLSPRDASEQLQQTDTEETEQQVKTVTEKPDPQQVTDLLKEATEYVGEDKTLAELIQWCENNPDLLNTAIEMKL